MTDEPRADDLASRLDTALEAAFPDNLFTVSLLTVRSAAVSWSGNATVANVRAVIDANLKGREYVTLVPTWTAPRSGHVADYRTSVYTGSISADSGTAKEACIALLREFLALYESSSGDERTISSIAFTYDDWALGTVAIQANLKER